MTAAPDTMPMGEVSAFIAERMGLNFPEERWPDLARGLEAAGPELGFGSPAAWVRGLRDRQMTTRQVETLASYLTVGETYFLRDPASFEALEREILPPLIARRSKAGRALRLWSAGCSTGEEAYSLAITCTRALVDLRAWNVSVLATDINAKCLATAEAGVYSEWSFRGAPGWLREQFFSLAPDKKLAIDPVLKKLVRFAYLNLAEDPYPSIANHTNALDVIFCRNVLMYFTPDHQRRVAAALHGCLVDGGCLLVSPAEASSALFSMFAAESLGDITVYRKTSTRTPVECRPRPAWPGAVASIPQPEPSSIAARPPPEPTAPAPPVAPTPASPREDLLARARAYANQGRLEEGLTWCRDAILAERTDPAGYLLYAAICDELGRSEEAVVALRKVLYLDQDLVLAHHALAGLHKRLGRPKESRRHRAIALELLTRKGRDEIVPDSDGITCGRLLESVRAMTGA